MTTEKNDPLQATAYLNRVMQLGATPYPIYKKEDGSGSFVIVPEGMKVHDIHMDGYAPGYISRKSAFSLPDSFIEYLKDYINSDGRTVVFANEQTDSFLGVIDYHMQPANITADDQGRRCAHHATMALTKDETYSRFASINGSWLSQLEMAQFLEENLVAVIAPDGSTLMELITKFEVAQNAEFKKAINMTSSTVELTFNQRDQVAGSFVVPRQITIVTPVYFGGQPKEIELFFRYKASGGNLSFKLDMHRKAYMERDAFLAIVTRIADTAMVPVYLGRTS